MSSTRVGCLWGGRRDIGVPQHGIDIPRVPQHVSAWAVLCEARAFVCVCALVGHSRKLLGESSEVFVPATHDRSRLPLHRINWVRPLATRT